MAKERLVVISIDRDNDLGQKLGIKGPLIGRDKALKAAADLSLKDPEESDANAIFGTVKVFDELKTKYDAIVAGTDG